jgi:GNAT superfamily N-acetyltransferase
LGAPVSAGEKRDPKKSSPAITYKVERFAHVVKEMTPLWHREWAELGQEHYKIDLDPDWDRYLQYDLAQILHLITARADGKIVGYILLFAFGHIHHVNVLWAQGDHFWLDPSYRKGRTGINLFTQAKLHAKALGCKFLSINILLHFAAERGTIGKLLERLGAKATEMTYTFEL